MPNESDPFRNLRPALAPHLRDQSERAIRTHLAMQGIDADAAEDFFGSLGRAASSIGSAIAPRLGNIAQGALQGAGTGMALGPWGALAGALGGGLAGGLAAPGAPPRAPTPAGVGAAAAPGGLGGLAGLLGGLTGPGRKTEL